MHIPKPPDGGEERRDRNRLARDLIEQATTHDEFFDAFKEIQPEMSHFSNFPRRLLSEPGYTITMFGGMLQLETSRRQTRDKILALQDAARSESDESSIINAQEIICRCKERREKFVPRLSPDTQQRHIDAWNLLEDSYLALIAEEGRGKIGDMKLFLSGLRSELEMRESAEKYNQEHQLLQGSTVFQKENHLIGNEKIFEAYKTGDKEVREILFKIAKYLVLEKGLDFDEIW